MTVVDATLARSIALQSGENAYKCYQCKKCTTGCPVAEFADLHPAQIMRAVQVGALDRVLASRFIWLCTGCQTCSTRCPQSIDVAGTMDQLRMIARTQNKVPADAPFAGILKLNYQSMRRWGRLWEVELIALDALKRPKEAIRDLMPLGPKMMLKGKVNPVPTVGDRAQMKRMAAEADRVEAEKAAARKSKGGLA